jgi:hypothetical protein
MFVRDKLLWIESGGGPLILIDSELASEWGGISGNYGSPESISDYERACAVDDYLGVVDLRRGTALVLGDEPMRTSIVTVEPNDVLVVRWVWAPNERKIVESLPMALVSDDWVETDCKLTHSSESFVIFDSAEQFREANDLITFPFSHRLSKISTLEFKPNDAIFLVLHRIKGIESVKTHKHIQ